MLAGLLLKDIYSLKKTFKIYLLMLVVFVAAAIFSGDGTGEVNMFAGYVNTLLTILGINLLLQTFTTDEACGWSSYCMVLPVERKDIVKSKYLFAGLMYILALSASLVMGIGMYIVQGMSISGTIRTFLWGSFFVILVTMILLPLIFKYNSERSRMLLIGILIIPSIFVIMAAKVLEPDTLKKIARFIEIVKPYINTLKFVLPVILLVIIYISYRTSVAIFNKKEL